MATTLHRTHAPMRSGVASTAPVTLTKVLLACGVLYSLSYAVFNDVIAASRYDGYSRMSQAVSELSATGAPTKSFLTATLPVSVVLMLAFGIGVWRSAGGARSLRILGALFVAHALTFIAWLPFPMSSREDIVSGNVPANDVGHIVLTVITLTLIVAQLGFGAAAFGLWFRVYTLATAVTVLVFGAMTGTEAPKVQRGEPTPWMGLFERMNIGAWLLWLAVLAIVLLQTRADPRVPERPAAR